MENFLVSSRILLNSSLDDQVAVVEANRGNDGFRKLNHSILSIKDSLYELQLRLHLSVDEIETSLQS